MGIWVSHKFPFSICCCCFVFFCCCCCFFFWLTYTETCSKIWVRWISLVRNIKFSSYKIYIWSKFEDSNIYNSWDLARNKFTMSKLLGEKIPTCCLPNYMQCMCINLNLSFCLNYSCNTSATLSIGSLRYVHLRKLQFLSEYKFCLYTYLIELINIISMEIQTSSSYVQKYWVAPGLTQPFILLRLIRWISEIKSKLPPHSSSTAFRKFKTIPKKWTLSFSPNKTIAF